jgi:hypothetical protein
MVGDNTLLAERGTNASPAVGLELASDGGDRLNDDGIVRRDLWPVVI